MTKQQEPYESRDSRTDLWGPRGATPLGYPAPVTSLSCKNFTFTRIGKKNYFLTFSRRL